jgi:hypothetical protein
LPRSSSLVSADRHKQNFEPASDESSSPIQHYTSPFLLRRQAAAQKEKERQKKGGGGGEEEEHKNGPDEKGKGKEEMAFLLQQYGGKKERENKAANGEDNAVVVVVPSVTDSWASRYLRERRKEAAEKEKNDSPQIGAKCHPSTSTALLNVQAGPSWRRDEWQQMGDGNEKEGAGGGGGGNAHVNGGGKKDQSEEFRQVWRGEWKGELL